MNYSTLAFSDAARKIQEKAGSRANYARRERQSQTDGLTENESAFIAERDSFYMATLGANGFPYIQFRGGPKGFLKTIDSTRLAFVDFRGNMQYISVGNLATNNKVSLILMDYPTRTRLKLYAEAEVVELKDDPALFEKLDLENYKFRPERMVVLHVKAYDWNCPQHITPRYTLEEIGDAFASQQDYIAKLEAEIKTLKQSAT
ncbi:pyridoxamine 5'-phosphate oxidase family protein [Chryseolinea lacunae]|uniref:Pyridoxamine 5'-phosphate oxidase family protein n=1 Tax=Chryseolinea lacunae TaxID=2801331 RepID=A0ABS1KRA0_9BACT|nr:pyridoxamine 5'-phosphate oxidase family protein [Chryseolinea lacunae]MBL0741956.1 pyridoxamine 5'-phosphate oxidase family protein [Chryseolinea lacunae]